MLEGSSSMNNVVSVHVLIQVATVQIFQERIILVSKTDPPHHWSKVAAVIERVSEGTGAKVEDLVSEDCSVLLYVRSFKVLGCAVFERSLGNWPVTKVSCKGVVVEKASAAGSLSRYGIMRKGEINCGRKAYCWPLLYMIERS